MKPQDALERARLAFTTSTSYVDANLRRGWELNERQFQGRHPIGSKYYSDSYKYRSKLYRPKTRATIQSNEADCAFAFFSNQKVIDVSPYDDNDPQQRASAAILEQLVQYRLTKTIPWFQIVQGGYQDAQKHDVVIGHLYWCYREKTTRRKAVLTDPFGEPEERMVEEVETLDDHPVIELRPIENIRLDPASLWTNPASTSPYLIDILPMTVDEIRARMLAADPKTGEPKWKVYDAKEIGVASASTVDTTRLERNWDRDDPEDQPAEPHRYSIAYVHRNFVRENGEDWFFYTLGCEKLLTDPVPAREVYWQLRRNERPYIIGTAGVETHKTYPEAGVCQLTRPLQQEVNDLTNLRIDNLKLAINGRYKVLNTANVDYESLRNNIPGSGVLMDRLDAVELLETKDVTASSYQEQDRMNADFDDLAGSFSPSTVNTNRRMGETVGGLQLVSAAATKVGDYRILTYAETWLEPLLDQFVRLEQAYETDEVVLALAGQKAKLFQKFGINQVTDELLRQSLAVTVNVGISSTDPTTKVQRLLYGLKAIAEVTDPQLFAQVVKLEELVPEVFGALGYRDGTRFFRNFETGDDPRIMQLMQQVQQLQQAIQTKQVEEEGRNKRMQEIQDKKLYEGIQKELIKGEYGLAEEEMKSGTALTTTAIQANSARPAA